MQLIGFASVFLVPGIFGSTSQSCDLFTKPTFSRRSRLIVAIISSVSLLRKKGARKNPFALVNTYNLFHGRPGVSLQHIYMPWPNNKYSLISFFLTSQIFWSLSTHTPLRPAFVSLVFRKKSSTTARFKKGMCHEIVWLSATARVSLSLE